MGKKNNISNRTLLDFLKGKLVKEDARTLEEELNSEELFMESMEGLRTIEAKDLDDDLDFISKQLSLPIKEETSVKTSYIWWAAASVIFVIGLSFWILQLRLTDSTHSVSSIKNEQVESEPNQIPNIALSTEAQEKSDSVTQHQQLAVVESKVVPKSSKNSEVISSSTKSSPTERSLSVEEADVSFDKENGEEVSAGAPSKINNGFELAIYYTSQAFLENNLPEYQYAESNKTKKESALTELKKSIESSAPAMERQNQSPTLNPTPVNLEKEIVEKLLLKDYTTAYQIIENQKDKLKKEDYLWFSALSLYNSKPKESAKILDELSKFPNRHQVAVETWKTSFR